MRTLASTSLLLWLVACGGGGNDTGSGSNTLLVDADIEATPEISNASEPADFTTEFHVRVTLNGAAVETGDVVIASDGGDVELIWDATDNGGRWRGAQAGYLETYTLDVTSGDDYVHGVSLDGPDIHSFTSPDGAAAVDATVPLAVEWSRDEEAEEAAIETEEMDRVTIADAGSFELPALTLRNKPDEAEQDEIRLTRSARIVPSGAVAGSELRVRIENRLELVVAATGL